MATGQTTPAGLVRVPFAALTPGAKFPIKGADGINYIYEVLPTGALQCASLDIEGLHTTEIPQMVLLCTDPELFERTPEVAVTAPPAPPAPPITGPYPILPGVMEFLMARKMKGYVSSFGINRVIMFMAGLKQAPAGTHLYESDGLNLFYDANGPRVIIHMITWVQMGSQIDIWLYTRPIGLGSPMAPKFDLMLRKIPCHQPDITEPVARYLRHIGVADFGDVSVYDMCTAWNYHKRFPDAADTHEGGVPMWRHAHTLVEKMGSVTQVNDLYIADGVVTHKRTHTRSIIDETIV